MLKANVLDLITVNPEAAGVGTEPAETKRTVFCTVKSIGQQEAYLSMAQGLNPELKAILAHDFEYQGERLAEMDGVRYDILRTYITEVDGFAFSHKGSTLTVRFTVHTVYENFTTETEVRIP